MDKHKLMGQKITVNKILVKSTYESNDDNYTYKTTHHVEEKIKNQTGWITGFRWLPNGVTKYDSFDNEPYWEETDRTECVLVSFSPYQNPFYIPLDGFELLGDENG